MSSEPFRLEADDPAVLTRTVLALQDSLAISDPPLRLLCQKCGALLAQAGDTAHGPLFTSSWEYEPELGHTVIQNDRALNRRESIAWREANEIIEYREGPPMNAPLRHGVRALLASGLPDYPDLLVRCGKHGDTVLDRDEVHSWIRQAAVKPMTRKIPVSKPFSQYRLPLSAPGSGATTHQREVWRPKLEVMTIEEYERRSRDRGGLP